MHRHSDIEYIDDIDDDKLGEFIKEIFSGYPIEGTFIEDDSMIVRLEQNYGTELYHKLDCNRQSYVPGI